METLNRNSASVADVVAPGTVAPEIAAEHEASIARRWAAIDVWRWMLWGALTATVWLAYYVWRPPSSMLGLPHTEHLGHGSRQVALSFDDAPHPVITPLLLGVLQRVNARASFFVIGDSLRFYPELTRRIIAEGHSLANHSQTHRNLTHVQGRDYDAEIEGCFATLRDATGARGSRMFRPPGGGLNRDVMEYLYQHDIRLAWWSNNVGDWARPPAWKIADQVKAHLRPGDIILLHDTPGGYGTPQAVPAIVRAAKRKGLSVVPMPEN